MRDNQPLPLWRDMLLVDAPYGPHLVRRHPRKTGGRPAIEQHDAPADPADRIVAVDAAGDPFDYDLHLESLSRHAPLAWHMPVWNNRTLCAEQWNFPFGADNTDHDDRRPRLCRRCAAALALPTRKPVPAAVRVVRLLVGQGPNRAAKELDALTTEDAAAVRAAVEVAARRTIVESGANGPGAATLRPPTPDDTPWMLSGSMNRPWAFWAAEAIDPPADVDPFSPAHLMGPACEDDWPFTAGCRHMLAVLEHVAADGKRP